MSYITQRSSKACIVCPYCLPKLCIKKTLFLRYDPKCFWPISLQDLQNLNISLWKSIDSHWFKNTLFELFNLQLCLFFFHEMIKFYKSICSAWISRTFAELFFLTNWSHMCGRNTTETSSIKLSVLL